MRPVFFYGSLRDEPLLACVLGRSARLVPAQMRDVAVYWVKGYEFPMVQEAPGGRAEGGLLVDPSEEELQRLAYYEDDFEFRLRDVTVETADGPVEAQVFWPTERQVPGEPWDLADWQARFGPLALVTAGIFMERFGKESMAEVNARYPSIAARAQAQLNAQETQPTSLRRRAEPGDVVIDRRDVPYASFFSLEEYTLRHRRFDGTMSAPIERSAFISCDAATVLPYDPVTDRVLLAEQFRLGPMARGDAQPWLLEAIAGRIDPGETPEAAARREAEEEAGLVLTDLRFVGSYYCSPGAKSEYLYSFLGLTSLSESAGGQFGMPGEGEDIRTHIISFDRLMELMDSGELDNGPLLISVLHLARLREALRAG